MRSIAFICALFVSLAGRAWADVPAAPDAEVVATRAIVDRWLAAQNTGDFPAYEALYAKRFEGIRRSGSKLVKLDRAGWMRDRKRMFKAPMKVTVDKLATETIRGRTRVRFVQTFESGDYKDEGDKELVIVGSRIVREEMVTSAKPGADGSVCDEMLCKATSTPAKIVTACDQACTAGVTKSCGELARIYELPECGITRDEVKATALYEKACGPENASACTFVAFERAKTDVAKAVPFYRRGCDGGDPYSCYTLAHLLLESTSIPHDPKLAVELLAVACDDFDRSAPGGMACHELWEMYRDGKGIKRNAEKAREYHHKYDNAVGGE